MTIEIFEPELKELIAPDAGLERIATGFHFTEGPIWNPIERCLYFSDIPGNTIYRYTQAAGVEVYRTPSNFSNGLTLDHQGRLIACEHRARRVTRAGANGLEVLASHYRYKRLNSPNDVIVASDGSVIFTDPPYGLNEGLGGPAKAELDFKGVYRIAPGKTEPTLLVDDFDGPNGLALSLDERKLYIDDSERSHIRVFDVNDDWTLSGGDVFLELRGEEEGVPDGLKLDARGNIFCTGPGGVWICSPEAVVLGRIRMPEVTANLNWGDDDYCTLYLAASSSIYRLRCQVSGAGMRVKGYDNQ